MAIAAVAIGSNLGNRLDHVREGVRAVCGLAQTRWLASSGVLETSAVVPPSAPAGPDYLNAAALIETGLEPSELLRQLLSIERSRGRDRGSEARWAPRTLDLDLLFMDRLVVRTESLTLPHPRMHERAFVLGPLVEVAPNWVHPVRGSTVAEMLAAL